MGLLTGMKALITGGSSGIGRAIALAFAEAGSDVAISYHNNEAGAAETIKSAQALGRKAAAFQADMAQLSDLEQLLEQAVNVLGEINILVNNAGTLTRHSNFMDIPMENFDHIMQVNLKAPFFLTQIVSNQMIKKNIKGSIVNISSMSAEIITPGLTHYECSKAALHMLTRASASALAQYGIRVNAIAPGLVETNINRSQREKDPQAWEKRAMNIPLKRVGCPEDIANIAVMLASKESDWMAGSIIPIDGGIGVRSPFA
jgi:NAD(P)-dependent dehydrogenase (short-subunit alcohol dehydrogenase family)